MSHNEFRRELRDITRLRDDDEVWEKIEGLRQKYEHSINRLELPHQHLFNCFMHAFRLDESQAHYKVNVSTDPSLYANGCFVFYLLAHRVLREKPIEKRQDGDILLYFDGEIAAHAAVAQAGAAVSKWGRGLFVRHDLLDVPENYGSEIRLFFPISVEEAEKHFLAFARCMGYGAA